MMRQDVPGDRALATTVVAVGAFWVVLSGGAVVASVLTGSGLPSLTAMGPVLLLGSPTAPASAFGPSVGPAWWYWVTTAVVTSAALVPVLLFWRRRSTSHTMLRGCASGAQVEAAAGRRALLRRTSVLRPALASARPQDIGYRLGSSRGVAAYASVEDSIVVLGPPRAGKGLHLVIPMILDAPGAVLTTSTRPDNLTTTLADRGRRGPVAAARSPSSTRKVSRRASRRRPGGPRSVAARILTSRWSAQKH